MLNDCRILHKHAIVVAELSQVLQFKLPETDTCKRYPSAADLRILSLGRPVNRQGQSELH